MIFSRREISALEERGIVARKVFIPSRSSPVAILTAIKQLRREIRLFKPSLIHAHYGSITSLCCAISTKLPLVITFHGSDLNPCPSKNQFRIILGHLFSQVSALKAQRVICVSKSLRDRLWWTKHRASIIPVGVERALFYPIERSLARSEIGWRAEPVILFNAGKEPEIKRLDLALESMKYVMATWIDARLAVLRGDVEPDRVPLYLNAADVLLVTSDYEGSPMIVKEAMMCGLPIVSVDVGDIKEHLSEVEPSQIAKRDPKELGAAILKILRIGIRSNGPAKSKMIELNFTIEKVIREYLLAIKSSQDNGQC